MVLGEMANSPSIRGGAAGGDGAVPRASSRGGMAAVAQATFDGNGVRALISNY